MCHSGTESAQGVDSNLYRQYNSGLSRVVRDEVNIILSSDETRNKHKDL